MHISYEYEYSLLFRFKYPITLIILNFLKYSSCEYVCFVRLISTAYYFKKLFIYKGSLF